jgi:hypothetical protein
MLLTPYMPFQLQGSLLTEVIGVLLHGRLQPIVIHVDHTLGVPLGDCPHFLTRGADRLSVFLMAEHTDRDGAL